MSDLSDGEVGVVIPVSVIDEVDRVFQWGMPNDDPAVYRELFIRLIREHNELEARVGRLERDG